MVFKYSLYSFKGPIKIVYKLPILKLFMLSKVQKKILHSQDLLVDDSILVLLIFMPS
jgi:hypothetical protein